MSQSKSDWDEDIPYNAEDEYQALLRALRRKRGFGLYFVECSAQKGNELIASLQKDLPQKNMQVLQLDRSTTTLYDLVEARWQQQPFDILFIQGLENALLEYEDTKRLAGWTSEEIYSYSWKGVPRILSHLNQQRERFRDNFNGCFVFLVSPFVVKYFIQRAPDFFDWRSGLFSFRDLSERAEQITSRILESREFEDYVQLTPAQRNEKLLALDDALYQQHTLTADDQAELWREKGRLLAAVDEYQAALICYDKAIEFKPDYHEAWNNRGAALSNLRRYEEAISSYDKVIEFKPDNYTVLAKRGTALASLGRYEEALISYDRAIEYKSDDCGYWVNRGIILSLLGRNKEALTSYDRAIEFKPDDYRVWFNRGILLFKLKRYEEASSSYAKALEIQPKNSKIWSRLAEVLYFSKYYEDAISSNMKALEFANEGESYPYWLQGIMLLDKGVFNDAVLMFTKATKFIPNSPFVWLWQGYSLYYAKQYAEALESFDQAISLKLDTGWEWNVGGRLKFKSDPSYLPLLGRSLVLVKMKRYREAFINFKNFLLNPDPYQDALVILKAIYSGEIERKQIILISKTLLGYFGVKSNKNEK
ncbi:MAG: tetratricopeptide repeat protein [Pegethrix bostrychoides GSE-TBD4-15B]|jgi:superkiller protein 3|uniref:Tetratricopeptide repeat protein n=1 Tax=Pegethrix bostrychoides GSE-TBD4-15B TaxID=2839662 RepID=A0A951U6J3_9CYAN|nr:tetratricopeptide repeat protein [Pegethrix bostrychoides GSE-TBD4-15B]